MALDRPATSKASGSSPVIQMDIGFLRGILWKVANPQADRVRKLETNPEIDRPLASEPNDVMAGRGSHLAVFGLLTDRRLLEPPTPWPCSPGKMNRNAPDIQCPGKNALPLNASRCIASHRIAGHPTRGREAR